MILDGLAADGPERSEALALAEDTSGSPLQVIQLLERRVQLAALLEVEDMAREALNWSPLLIPGLLQVSGYTRAIMEGAGVPDDEIATRVAIRMGRRDILTRRNPVRYTALIGENVLSHTFGGPQVMAEQLSHLLMMSAHENVDLRIVPIATAWHPGMDGPFMILTTPATTFVHLENVVTAMFVQEDEAVAAFKDSVRRLTDIAMSRDESYEFIARQVNVIAGGG